jgi:hypothetical protein
MQRFTIEASEQTWQDLRTLAAHAYRTPRQQAAFLLAHAVERAISIYYGGDIDKEGCDAEESAIEEETGGGDA